MAEWQARHLASYCAVVVDRAALWGSWQVTQPNAPPLSVLHRLQVQPAPCERTQSGFSRSPLPVPPVEDVAVVAAAFA